MGFQRCSAWQPVTSSRHIGSLLGPPGSKATEDPNHFWWYIPTPIGSMYSRFTYIWLISRFSRVHVGKYTIHGSYGIETTGIFAVGKNSMLTGVNSTPYCWWFRNPAITSQQKHIDFKVLYTNLNFHLLKVVGNNEQNIAQMVVWWWFTKAQSKKSR